MNKIRRFTSFIPALSFIEEEVSSGRVKLLSFDIFDTVILRRCDPDGVLQAVATWLDRELDDRNIANRHGLSLNAYHTAYALLARRNAEHGLDNEVLAKDLYVQWVLEAVGGNVAPDELVRLLRAKMHEFENWSCEANEQVRFFLKKIRYSGVKIIYISDMYIGQDCVAAILENCELLQFFDAGYVSGDFGLLKRTGRLFKKVIDIEGVDAADILHCGDNSYSDGIMAQRSGIRPVVVHDRTLLRRYSKAQDDYLRLQQRPQLSSGRFIASFAQAMPGTYLTTPEAYAHRVLGPIYAAFMHRVLERCLEEKIDHVYFLAREGFLLKTIFEKLASHRRDHQILPKATYLGVSRLSALFLGSHGFGLREIAVSISNGQRTLSNILSSLLIDKVKLAEIGARHGIYDTDSILPDYFMTWPPFMSLLEDEEILEITKHRQSETQEPLMQYLDQQGFFTSNKVALVDVGWAGQIQDSIYRGIRHRQDCPNILGIYLGMNLTGHQRKTPKNWMEWIICDEPHLEWNSLAALQFPQSFEAITRAPHGTVVGYRALCEVVEPVLKSDSEPSRQAEVKDDGYIALLQSGILAYVEQYSRAVYMYGISATENLPYARQMVGRMIRFPTKEEAVQLLRLRNISDLGSSALYQMGDIESITLIKPRAFKQRLKSSFWRYGTLSLWGWGSSFLQMAWNVLVDGHSLAKRAIVIDHGIVFHRPSESDMTISKSSGDAVKKHQLGTDLPKQLQRLATQEMRFHRLVSAHRATQPLTTQEVLVTYIAWWLTAQYCRLTGRHVPYFAGELPSNTFPPLRARLGRFMLKIRNLLNNG